MVSSSHNKTLNQRNFIAIADWMISDYDFNTRELLCYAIIYGFSQDGESKFTGSLSYLANWLNISRRDNVLRYLDALVEKGAITKEKKSSATKTWCEYSAIANKGKTSKADHIIISPFMIEELGLKDKELILYALIYGFSKSGSNSFFTGNNSYMAKWLAIDKQHVSRYTTSLIEKGLVEKIEETNCIKYRVIDTDSLNNNPNQNEYTITNIEDGRANQIEYTPNHFEYTPNQNEDSTLTKLSTNKLNNNLNNKLYKNLVVVNSELAHLDLSEEEKGKLEEKEEMDHQYLKEYPYVLPYMQVIAVEVLKSMLIYDEKVVSEAQDIFYAGLNTIKKGNKKQKEITEEMLSDLWRRAINICDPEVFTDIQKDKLSYFIGVIKNVIG